MINLTEEDIRFICENIMTPMSEEIVKMMDKRDEISAASLGRLFDSVADQLKTIRYEQRRDRQFYKQMFMALNHFDADCYNKVYEDYCRRYDEWAKGVQDD